MLGTECGLSIHVSYNHCYYCHFNLKSQMARILFLGHKDLSKALCKTEALCKTIKKKRKKKQKKPFCQLSLRVEPSHHKSLALKGQERRHQSELAGGRGRKTLVRLEWCTTCRSLPFRELCLCHPAPPLKAQNCLINKWLRGALILHLRAAGKGEAHGSFFHGT